MSRWRDEIRRRLDGATLNPAREAEIAQELEQHLEDRYAELRAMGASDAEAHRAAVDELRDIPRMRRELTDLVDAATLPPPGAPTRRLSLADWSHDVRYAVRMLRRSPGFALVAVLTLALGIGATVAIFSAVYAALFRPLPLVDADRLVVPVSVQRARNIQRGSVPYADYADWRELRDVFEQVAIFYPEQVDLASGQVPERISALIVSAEYFGVMQVQPTAGRLLVPADHDANAPPVVVISDRLWRQHFGQAPDVAGKTIRLAGRVVAVAGVAPVHRMWPADADLWEPMRPTELPDDVRTRRDDMIFLSIARLRSGIQIEEARARVVAIAERVARASGCPC